MRLFMLHFYVNVLEKSMNPSSPPSYWWIVGQAKFFSLSKAISLGEKKILTSKPEDGASSSTPSSKTYLLWNCNSLPIKDVGHLHIHIYCLFLLFVLLAFTLTKCHRLLCIQCMSCTSQIFLTLSHDHLTDWLNFFCNLDSTMLITVFICIGCYCKFHYI